MWFFDGNVNSSEQWSQKATSRATAIADKVSISMCFPLVISRIVL
jgi:hypothetical protein